MRISEPQLVTLSKIVPANKLKLFKFLSMTSVSSVEGKKTLTVKPRFDMELLVDAIPNKAGKYSFHSLNFKIKSLGKAWTLTAKDLKGLKEKRVKAWIGAMTKAALEAPTIEGERPKGD